MSADLMTPYDELHERQHFGGAKGPAALTRKAALAEALVRSEGARAECSEIMADLLMDRLRWPSDFGPAIVLDVHGDPAPDITVADLIKQARAAHGWAFAGGLIPPATSSPTTLTERAKAEHAARQDSAKAAEQADTSNPYRPATRNLTQQAILEKRDPATAARLRAEAGVR